MAIIGGAAYFLPKMFEQEPTADIQVPNLIGLSEQQARNAVADAGLRVGDVSYEASEDAEKDRVIEQEPNRDEFVEDGTSVDFVVSSGKPMVTVPSVLGQTTDAARAAMTAAGLKVRVTEAESDRAPGRGAHDRPGGRGERPRGHDGEPVGLRRTRAGSRRGRAEPGRRPSRGCGRRASRCS